MIRYNRRLTNMYLMNYTMMYQIFFHATLHKNVVGADILTFDDPVL